MDIKSKELTQWNRKQRRNNKIKLLLVLAIALLLLVKGYFLIAIAVLLLMYLFQELLWSDHIFYDPRQDYCYKLNADLCECIKLNNNIILWKEVYKHKSLFLEIELQSTITGFIFDPYIEIVSGAIKQTQFFERRLNGKRFLNLSHINESTENHLALCDNVILNFKHCKIKNHSAILQGFEQQTFNDKKILVIAPHADDAEIAAFGLYSQHNSFIATITAGEVEAEYYETDLISPVEASQLKGRLRAWDSIAVPQWAGIKTDHIIQLGYFCLTLEQMKHNPEQSVGSMTADICEPGFFRTWNTIDLKSDKESLANWPSLIDDLAEIIENYLPDIICTPHPLLDPHKDHYYSTIACIEACEKSGLSPDYLLYANHHNHTDMSPFGLAGSLVSLPPEFVEHKTAVSICSYQLNNKTQYDKRSALAMMHDLTAPISFKKKLRQKLQSLLIGRETFAFGKDDYFRKAVRQNELFFKLNQVQLKQLVEEK